jgi:CheY-like chemotaxis protein
MRPLHDASTNAVGEKAEIPCDPEPAPHRSVRILVVDDEDLIREMLTRFLSLCGYEVLTAGDGETAVQEVLRHRPDAVVTDMHMPGMNGVHVLRRLRNDQYEGKVVLLSATQNEQRMQEARELKVDRILSKPVELKHLAGVLRDLLA